MVSTRSVQAREHAASALIERAAAGEEFLLPPVARVESQGAPESSEAPSPSTAREDGYETGFVSRLGGVGMVTKET